MRLSLRYRLLLPLALLLLGDAAATVWAAQTAARAAERRLAKQQWAVAKTLTQSKYPLTDPVLQQMKGLSGAEFLLVPAGGSPRATFGIPPDPPVDVPTAEQPGDDDEHTLGPPVTVAGVEYRCLRLPLKQFPNAGGVLYIFYPEEERRTAVADAVRPLVVLGGVSGLGAVVLALAFGARLVRRVHELDTRTRLIAGGDFRPVPVRGGNDELRDLGNAVNDMARQLAAFQDEVQRNERLGVLGQFSGGLAHQLRNAAAGARLAVELFLAENPAADPEPLQVALRQLARIESNLRQFLALGKPPAGERKPCDVTELIDQSVSLLRPQCTHAGTTVVWERPAQSVGVVGDAAMLSHLLGNVIGNAVEAAGPGGDVRISLFANELPLRVEVSDSGPGPPPGIADKLFDPFVTGKEQGIGLGLAVAKQAAETHGGSVRWERRDGRTVFVIELSN